MRRLNKDALEKNIASLQTRQKLVGLALGVVQDGKLVYDYCGGLADVANATAVSPQTVFRIASVSKIVTAVALMRFWEQHRFQLDDPVNQHLKSYQLQPRHAQDPPVTIRHLLTHTAGLGELAPLLSYLHPRAPFGVGWFPPRPLLSLARFYGHRLTPNAPPATKWAYANHGFATLGQLVADLSPQPLRSYRAFADHLRQTMFEPLGMWHSDFLRRPAVRQTLAVGYSTRKDGSPRPVWPDVDLLTQADGSLFTTLADFSRWVMALLEANSLLQPATKTLMWQPHFQLHEILPAMGLGFFREQWGDTAVVGHNGAWLGFNAAVWLSPETETAVYAFTNTSNARLISFVQNILRQLISAPNPAETLPDLPDLPRTWANILGHYQPAPGWNSNFRLWQGYGNRLTLYRQRNQLFIKSRWGAYKKGYRLRRYSDEDPHIFHLNAQPIVLQPMENGRGYDLLLRYHRFHQQT